MSMTQFAMVEELAFLVKDNLPCKHLVLTMEEAFVNFLQDATSTDGVLELEPMNPYSRLLLHRLADIFGFAHESVGEGDDRHLILERCPETSIPSILVSDILWQFDEPLSPITSHQLLRRKDASPVFVTETSSLQHSLEERNAAYLAARERIFSMNLGEVKESVKQKPRTDPVVARRMIAHALGQRTHPKNQDILPRNGVNCGMLIEDVEDKNIRDSNLVEDSQQFAQVSRNSKGRMKNVDISNATSLGKTSAPQKQTNKTSADDTQNGRSRNSLNKEYLKKEHLGAAKRMFAHALGMPSGKDCYPSRSRELNQNNAE
ncbi:R3H domain containing protein [Quillaja saponaria]|uniref:R3H domain containing protein n=1 Tax=Quillaja saponaria TaxID=32244 RepID=A0AAD7QB54_QUISA|nr:R3H domain containing protein [Quillaja saponaria]